MTEDDTFKVLKRKVSFPEMCSIILSKESDGVDIHALLTQYGWELADMFSVYKTITAKDLRGASR